TIRVNGVHKLNPDTSVHFNYYEHKIYEIIGDDIYKIDEFQLGYKGLVIANGLQSYSTPLNKFIGERTGTSISNYNDEMEMQDNDVFCSTFPKLSGIIRKFGFKTIKELDRLPITSLAEVVADAYLKQINLIK
ncbi:hypothetical protein, partial [Acinetobacter baumannii]|uniref:hypothetical protein n=1 Tax=Acinetobacter baumannii TaxID=470 RepID=UPI0038B42A9E